MDATDPMFRTGRHWTPKWRSLALVLLLVATCFAPLAAVGAERRSGAVEPRVVGGTIVPPGTYPFIVSIVAQTKQVTWLCGGTLISSTKVLTAAHCVSDDRGRKVGPKAFTVTVNRTNRKAKRQGFSRKVRAVARHPLFKNQGNFPYDVAVLTLRTPANVSQYVALPSNADDLPDLTATVAGWGATREGRRVSDQMREATLATITNSKCFNDLRGYVSGSELDTQYLCAVAPRKDSCQGDSGGPLFREINSESAANVVQIGIVSWGIGCAKSFVTNDGKTVWYPGVYTRLSNDEVKQFVTLQLAQP